MRKFLMGAAAALILGAAGATVAAESSGAFPKASGGISGEMIRANLESMGYRVDRLEAEHGYWEVVAVNDTGLPIKVKYDQGTGEMISANLL